MGGRLLESTYFLHDRYDIAHRDGYHDASRGAPRERTRGGTVVGELQYSRTISPNDQMWKTGPSWYYDVGLSALACINHALMLANKVPTAILDMPCGHGRICRMLQAAFPGAHLTACDLDVDGVNFCAQTFHAEGVYSHDDPYRVRFDRLFDLIWCGSLLTHLDRSRWPLFLSFFANHLKPDGVLVFTTHGRQPVQWMMDGFYDYGLDDQERQDILRDYAMDGFGYMESKTHGYGVSVSSMAFVCDAVQRLRTLKIIGMQEAGWAGHQDVYSCVRMRSSFPDVKRTLSGSHDPRALGQNGQHAVNGHHGPNGHHGHAGQDGHNGHGGHTGQAGHSGPASVSADPALPRNTGWCACCRADVEFVEMGMWLRDQYLCTQCGSIPRNRALNLTLDKHFPSWTSLRVHESSPSNDFIHRYCTSYSASYLFDGVPRGTLHNGARCEDLEQLTFADGTFDLVITQDVLEHVFDPARALHEIMRTIRPGGAHVFTTPKHRQLTATRRRARLNGAIVTHLLEPEYHGNPIGDGRALVTWDYGDDFEALATEWSGFQTVTYATRDRRFGLDGEYLEVFVTRKPA